MSVNISIRGTSTSCITIQSADRRTDAGLLGLFYVAARIPRPCTNPAECSYRQRAGAHQSKRCFAKVMLADRKPLLQPEQEVKNGKLATGEIIGDVIKLTNPVLTKDFAAWTCALEFRRLFVFYVLGDNSTNNRRRWLTFSWSISITRIGITRVGYDRNRCNISGLVNSEAISSADATSLKFVSVVFRAKLLRSKASCSDGQLP